MKRFLYSFVLLLVSTFSFAQFSDFASPINNKILLNGNFGEIRGNHFHAGIDIKTNGTTGLPVCAVQNGFVSRITISSTGYGNAIYIEHPSGYTSVYGHLLRFSPEIQKWVHLQQYEQRTFEINLEPKIGQFLVTKGDTIAYSGNSGNSGGPHLHFELRKTETQHPINPLFLGYNVSDAIKPVVSNLYVYPLSNESNIQNVHKKQRFSLALANGSYHIKGNSEIIKGWGEIGFGVDALDFFDGSPNKCGVYKIELRVDDELINTVAFYELDFNKTRQSNSQIDYEELLKNNRKVHKTFIDPGNTLPIYINPIKRGTFSFTDGQKHFVKISLYDAQLNRSDIVFSLLSTSKTDLPEEKYTSLFRYDRNNEFKNNEVELKLPEEALFTDLKFKYKMTPGIPTTFSNIHHLHHYLIPLNKNAEIRIKPTSLPERLRDKALLATVDLATNKLVSVGGEYSMGWVKASSKVLGNFCIVADTIAPKINSLSIPDNKTFTDKQQIRFRITDNLSGIKSYNGSIDDRWVLFEYDAKDNLLIYHFDEYIDKGHSHVLKLVVTDNKDNARIYNATFNY
ncbi:MAG TPA: M23 family metallopeptidase [Prolixibacteraceae bacterium]|nr:M23 family metallopeptidase [Prolixibacteraceae bacterium]